MSSRTSSTRRPERRRTCRTTCTSTGPAARAERQGHHGAVRGVTGNPVSDGIGAVPLDHPCSNSNFEDQIAPIGPATGGVHRRLVGNRCLTMADPGYKVVFLAFPFEAYGSAAQKADLIHRVLTYSVRSPTHGFGRPASDRCPAGQNLERAGEFGGQRLGRGRSAAARRRGSARRRAGAARRPGTARRRRSRPARAAPPSRTPGPSPRTPGRPPSAGRRPRRARRAARPAARSSCEHPAARASGTMTPIEPSTVQARAHRRRPVDGGRSATRRCPGGSRWRAGRPAAMCGSSRLATSSTSPGTR